MYVFAEDGCARNWNSESSPVGVWPPLHVTFVTTAASPEPVDATCMCHPGPGGTNESIPNPAGTVSTIFEVVGPAFSVGTARLYSCSSLDRDTAGLIRACADAAAGAVSAAAVAAGAVSAARPPRASVPSPGPPPGR